MALEVVGMKLGTAPENTDLKLLSLNSFGNEMQVQTANSQGFDYIYGTGDPRYVTNLRTRRYSDKPNPKNPKDDPKDHSSITLEFDVVERDSVTLEVKEQGRASIVIAINWPQNVTWSSAVVRTGLENTYGLTFTQLTDSVPNSVVLDKIGNRYTDFY